MVFVALVIVGLCGGSFVNALVWRLHEQAKAKNYKLSKNSKQLSILKGHSMCPNCRHQLAALDLVPVFSWLWLKGKCRYCHKPISAQYPVVELLTATLFLLSYVFWPGSFSALGTSLFIFWLIFLTGLVALAVYDLKWYLLPDRLIYPLLLVSLVQAVVLVCYASSPAHQLTSLLLSFIVGGGIFYAIFQVSAGKWIGGGDVKLGALLGLILASPSLMLLTIFIASLLGTLLALPMMAVGKFKRTTKVPFGPFLIIGAIITQLFGVSLINWYKHKLLYY